MPKFKSVLIPFVIIILGVFAYLLWPESSEVTVELEPTDVLETSVELEPALDEEPEQVSETTPLFFTSMIHMESNFKDDRNEQIFIRHIADLDFAMDLFEEYEAIVTVESEQPFARANHIWGVNVLQDVLDRGFGVGTHCDFGVNEPDMSPEKYSEMYKENKKLVDDLVGAENNKGCSGGWGPNDWVLGAALGGFDYLDAVVGFAYLSMPLESRPDGWTDEFITETTYHDSAPVDFMDRLYLFDLANAEDFEADKDGVITISGGDIGEISSLYEGRESCGSTCEFTKEDVAVVLEMIDLANEERDTSRIAKLSIHMPLTTFVPANEEILRYFFEEMQAYADAGKIVWASQLEVYNFYKKRSS
jgi:hypothetical protein